MKNSPNRLRYIIAYTTSYLMFSAVFARALNTSWDSSDQAWTVGGLLLAFLALLIVEPWITQHKKNFLHLYNFIQSIIIITLILVSVEDYFAVLWIILLVVSIWTFSLKIAFAWVGIILACMFISLFGTFGFDKGLGYVFTYLGAYILFCGFGVVTLQAERAQKESQRLLVELQAAHQKLQAYTSQVEELTAAQERNRLARELHDSVTQTIFSLTLTAQAARILLNRDPGKAAAQLDHLQELAQNALTEMRSLIQQLRPKTLAEEGLVSALKRHFSERQAQEDLTIDFQVLNERRLAVDAEETLFRVIQEALNNIVKHAQTNQASIHLDFSVPKLLVIEDQGCGFDPVLVKSAPGHLGLASMQERIAALGGILKIESQPGKGTRLSIENLNLEEKANGN